MSRIAQILAFASLSEILEEIQGTIEKDPMVESTRKLRNLIRDAKYEAQRLERIEIVGKERNDNV